ncbi:MAG: type III secretion system chaperone family protein [Hyphococcus sp.]
MRSFSAADVQSMMAELAIQAAPQPYQGDGASSLIATTSGGATFVVTMLQCEDPETGQSCTQAVLYTAASNAGIAYEDLNSFHENSDVTRAINVPDEQMIVFGMQIFSRGGIGRENFQLLTALFLNYMQRYVDGQMAAASTVALRSMGAKGGKTDNIGARNESSLAPTAFTDTYAYAVKAAVANTRHVEFLTGNASKVID